MKVIGWIAVIIATICFCFSKCASDETKIKVYSETDAYLERQIDDCNKNIAERDTIKPQVIKNDSI